MLQATVMYRIAVYSLVVILTGTTCIAAHAQPITVLRTGFADVGQLNGGIEIFGGRDLGYRSFGFARTVHPKTFPNEIFNWKDPFSEADWISPAEFSTSSGESGNADVGTYGYVFRDMFFSPVPGTLSISYLSDNEVTAIIFSNPSNCIVLGETSNPDCTNFPLPGPPFPGSVSFQDPRTAEIDLSSIPEGAYDITVQVFNDPGVAANPTGLNLVATETIPEPPTFVLLIIGMVSLLGFHQKHLYGQKAHACKDAGTIAGPL